MTPKNFEIWLHDAIQLARAEEEEERHGAAEVRRVATYQETGVLTNDRGLVVTFDDGSEIQVTLVLSRRGRNDEDEDGE